MSVKPLSSVQVRVRQRATVRGAQAKRGEDGRKLEIERGAQRLNRSAFGRCEPMGRWEMMSMRKT